MNRRNDYKMALMVESIIHDTAIHTPVLAARQLAQLGVPLEVAMRVITRPAERRNQVEEMQVERLHVEHLAEVRRAPADNERA